MKIPPVLRRTRTYLIAIPALVLLIAVGGPWVYINLIKEDAPPPLSFDDIGAPSTTRSDTTATPTSTGDGPLGPIEGDWTVQAGSQAGYRVHEVIAGQDTDTAGRTQILFYRD